MTRKKKKQPPDLARTPPPRALLLPEAPRSIWTSRSRAPRPAPHAGVPRHCRRPPAVVHYPLPHTLSLFFSLSFLSLKSCLCQERQRHGSRCEASLHPDLTWEGVALRSGAASGGGGEVGGEHGDGRAETKEEKNGEAGRLRSGSASGGDSEAGGAHGDEGPENGGVRERGLHRRQSHCQAGRARGAHGSSPGAAHEGMRWGSSCRHTTRRSPLLHTSSELHLLVLHLGIH